MTSHDATAAAGRELYPVFLDLAGCSALVVGGGAVALRKAEALVRAGASVRVVAPVVSAGLATLEAGGRVEIARREFAAADVDGAMLVFAATGVEAVDTAVVAAARERGALANVADDPESGDFHVPASGRSGAIQVAVSTGGASPALAARLRDRFVASLGPEWQRFAELLREMRQAARETIAEGPVRHRALARAAADDALLAAVARGEDVDPRSAIEREVAVEQGGGSGAEPDAEAAIPSRALVSLVGAGPGAPELITVLGRRRIAEADVIVYDDLVDRGMLSAARPDAEFVYAGKRGWREGPERPETGELLVARAREGAGKRVVRLKGGDPMVFGRAGEEMATLAEAGVPFEVVPGVTAALSVAASAGIPLTLRGVSNSLTLVAGNAATEPAAPATGLAEQLSDADAAPPVANLATVALAGGTLCVYMGLKGLADIADGLVERGVAESLPVAVVSGAFTPAQQSVAGTLGDIAARVRAAQVASPALVVIGRVVEFSIAPIAEADRT